MASKELTYLSDQGPFDVYDKGKLKEPIDSLEEETDFHKKLVMTLLI